jgi:hypothetical protein
LLLAYNCLEYFLYQYLNPHQTVSYFPSIDKNNSEYTIEKEFSMFFLPDFSGSFFYHFLSAYESSISHSFIDKLVKCLSFPLSGNILLSPLFYFILFGGTAV